uniref:Uncharacterized protein n=1 Tax=Ciona intestinalis TaxID=7719 RepID=H2XM40_CIOIN
MKWCLIFPPPYCILPIKHAISNNVEL